MNRPSIHTVATAACVLAVAGLAGACSSDLNPLKAAYQPGPAAPAFVAASRKEGGDFLPVGVSAPARPIRAKSAEGTKALEAELVGARGRNEAQGRSAESAGRATRPASATPEASAEGGPRRTFLAVGAKKITVGAKRAK